MRSPGTFRLFPFLGLWLGLSAGTAPAQVGALPPLGAFELPRGGGAAATGDGGLVTLDPRAGEVIVWSAEGRAVDRFRLPGTLRPAVPSRLAARRDAILVALAGPVDAPVRFAVIDMASHEVTGGFEAPEWPAGIFGGANGWVFRSEDEDAQAVVEVDDHGRPLRTFTLPGDLADRVDAAIGDRRRARTLVAAAGETLWAVPAGMYEVWRLDGGTERLDVPKCLWIAGNQLEGDVARRKALQRLADADESARRFIEPRLKASMGTGRQFHFFTSAIPAVSALADRFAVLVDSHPELADGSCRLDVWRVPGGALAASVQVPGRCPGMVALGDGAAWVRQGRRFSRISLTGTGAARTAGCGVPPSGALRLAAHDGTGGPGRQREPEGGGSHD